MSVLKKFLGDGGGGFDAIHGSSSLRDVLKDICQEKRPLVSAYLGTIATGILAGGVASGVRPDGTKYTRKPVLFAVAVDVCGSAGSTVVEFRVNGSVQATLTFANTDPDPTVKTAAITATLADGDRYDINVSTAPTGGTGLRATVYETFGSVDVEA